jgi:hypothetical protein
MSTRENLGPGYGAAIERLKVRQPDLVTPITDYVAALNLEASRYRREAQTLRKAIGGSRVR